MSQTTINLEIGMKRKLKIYCATIDVQMSDFVYAAVQEKMERETIE